MKILIVDDSKGSRDVIKFLIVQKNNDATVFEAANGLDAIEALKENFVDIMITDIKMPQMDGLELIEKARGISPELQIIVFSAFGNFEFAKKALQFGVTDYLLKPINSDEFYKTLFDVSEKYNQKQHSLIWQQYDSCVNAQKQECEYLPSPLDRYSLLLLVNCGECGEHAISKAANFIKNNIDDCLIRQEKSSLTVLAKGSEDCERGFDTSVYRALSDILPCSVYYGCFDNAAVSLISTQKSIADRLKEDIFWGRTNCLLNMGDLTPEQSDISLLFDTAQKIGRGILRKEENAERAIEKLVGTMLEYDISSKQCKYVFFEIIKQFLGGTSSPFYYEQAIEDITAASTIFELKERFALMASLITETDQPHDSGELSTVTRTAIGIIHNEYMNDLNRTDIARRVYISSPYFSHIFKKETGKSFTKYLNDFRMEKACVLLKSTSHNIYAIAKMVGFSNYPYFCSQFKKKFGQTCIQYRENSFRTG